MDDSPNPSASTGTPSLAPLSAQLGQPLAFEDGQCALAFDGDVEVVIAAAAMPAVLTVRSKVAAVRPDVLRAAMALNYGGLPPALALALDERTDQVMLLAHHAADEPSPSGLVDLVALFVALVPLLRAQLEPALADDAPPSPVSAPDPFGFIRG